MTPLFPLILSVLFVPAPRMEMRKAIKISEMTQAQAEQIASRWWSAWYRPNIPNGPHGAAFYDGYGTCHVGICDGKIEHAGTVNKALITPEGGFTVGWEAKFKSPSGLYYKNALWFGKGKTWGAALYNATLNGYVPMKGADFDFEEYRQYCDQLRMPLHHLGK